MQVKGSLWDRPDYPLRITSVPSKRKGYVITTIESPFGLAANISNAVYLLVQLSQNLQTEFTRARLNVRSMEIRAEEAHRAVKLYNAYFKLRRSGFMHRDTLRLLTADPHVNPLQWDTDILHHYVPTARQAALKLRETKQRRLKQPRGQGVGV